MLVFQMKVISGSLLTKWRMVRFVEAHKIGIGARRSFLRFDLSVFVFVCFGTVYMDHEVNASTRKVNWRNTKWQNMWRNMEAMQYLWQQKSEETSCYDTCRQCEQLYSDETSRMRVCAVFVIKMQWRVEETPRYDTSRQCEQLYSDETSRIRVSAVFVIKRKLRCEGT